jgi:menaquinone-specific isochorismate synthase
VPVPATLSPVTQLRVETTRVDDPRFLIKFADESSPLIWVRKGYGMAGIGEAVRLTFSGPDRMAQAGEAWRAIVSAATVHDPVQVPGSGLIAFGTFAFDDASAAESVLIVPRTVVGRRGDTAWVTRIRLDGDTAPAPEPELHRLGEEYRLTLLPGEVAPERYRAMVEAAVERIAAGELSKVVLARDLHGHLPAGSDLRRVLYDLALGYPDCWTYAIDGFVGSSPETLVRVDHGTVSARVLAGTTARGADAVSDQERAVALATSTKDLDEHGFAVRSVLAALEPHSAGLATSELPFTLKLPNLWHLASDVIGTLSDGSTSLDLIAALHPTAAVAGTPTADALALIRELEPFDRGRYAGPVGWVGADGDGEWAIALRSAQVDAVGDITAFAGCGIVADSVPEREYLETKMKFRPVVEAFG